ncbi:class E sortase [Streptomyces sp. NPDC088789]|uniref:class E sortase n=1 Tax=Streptomyces sp. NPDC088789 TaxID=3365899 RepID=UPI0037F18A02
MTALRPERESGPAYGESSGYGDASAFRDATPHHDPARHDPGGPARHSPGGPARHDPARQGPGPGPGDNASRRSYDGSAQPYDHPPYDPGSSVAETQILPPITEPPPAAGPPPAGRPPAPGRSPVDRPAPAPGPPPDDETVALRVAEPPTRPISAAGGPADPSGTSPAPGGRAARRKAAKRRNGRRGGQGTPATRGAPATRAARATPAAPAARGATRAHAEGTAAGAGDGTPRASLSRVEARRLARARKPGPAVIASRAIGEVFITTGVLMLLFVTYQLWWTNVRAHAAAGKEASDLQEDWANGERNPGSFEPGQGFAILRMPTLDVVVPVAEGTSSKRVLDKGMVGHYADGQLKTAMPGDKSGNFGLAGHRNTHGEPFRYINKLKPGDPIVVETQDTYYVYKMASVLPVTSPGNISVLDPIPKDAGFTEPGRYITLTTCTPEFTSKYRLIVWGKMVEERPRSKGKPDALVS